MYRSDPEGAVQKANAAAQGFLTGAQVTAERTHRPILASRQMRQRQKGFFFEFIRTRERRISGYTREGVYGLPDTNVVFLDNVKLLGVVAFAHVGEPDASVAQLLTYLGLLKYYEHVFLGISSSHLPPRWAKYLQLTDPEYKRMLDPAGLGVTIFGPSVMGFSNLIEEHDWLDDNGTSDPVLKP